MITMINVNHARLALHFARDSSSFSGCIFIFTDMKIDIGYFHFYFHFHFYFNEEVHMLYNILFMAYPMNKLTIRKSPF
jgi:hypothetical protein